MSIDLNNAAKIMVETRDELNAVEQDQRSLDSKRAGIQRDRDRAQDALSKCVGANVRDRAFTVNGSVVVVSFEEEDNTVTVKVLDANGGKA